VWNSSGQVRTVNIIPLETLNRPRIDITVEFTSTLRDCFPNCFELLDEAIQMVAVLDEPLELNYIRKHVQQNMAVNGGNTRNATLRLFSNPPGAYISAVGLAVHASAWEHEKDLADVFIATGGYAYGKEVFGILEPEQFVRSLSTVNVTFDKTGADSCDMLGCCCYFSNHGGMTTAARVYSDNEVKAYYGDTRERENVVIRDVADEIRRIVRAKLFNPKWIEKIKKSGYLGGADISARVEHIYGWEASTQEVDDWIFDDITKTFVLNPEMKKFFEDNNPYAFEELTRRLLEASQRQLWKADPHTLEGLKQVYLEVESWLEDAVDEGEYQGGSVDILTSRDIESWGMSLMPIIERVNPKQLGHYIIIDPQEKK
jgi:cobaltochelatase CobN